MIRFNIPAAGITLLSAFIVTTVSPALAAQAAMTEEEAEAWLMEDTPPPTPYDDTLVFIQATAPPDLYRIRNDVRITPESLQSGWVTVHQCHENIDPVPDLEVVYQKATIDWIRIEETRNIQDARVQGHSVQLKDVQRGATLCVAIHKQMAKRDNANGYSLRHGPFYRRFLDGYYPMQVIHRVHSSSQTAKVSLTNREELEGAGISQDANDDITVDAHFAGKLNLDFRIVALSDEQ